MEFFDSLNSYQKLEVIVADDPQSLAAEIRKIILPMNIVAIVPHGNRQVAYVLTDARLRTSKNLRASKTKGE
jgi:hypothetical protein